MNPKLSHKICKKSLSYHLMRSRMNHALEKLRCLFNALHVTDEQDLQQNILSCVNDGNTEKCSFKPKVQLGTVPLETVKDLSVPVMQDWKEENVETYNPWKSTETKNIIRCITGLSKSQKKLFKLAERKRIKNLEASGISASNQKCFKHKISNCCISNADLVKILKKLSLDDSDALLEYFDINKLVISDIN